MTMKWWSVTLSLIVSLWGSPRAHAAGDIFEQASLQGLGAVEVVVENLATDISQDGLDRERIKVAVDISLWRRRPKMRSIFISAPSRMKQDCIATPFPCNFSNSCFYSATPVW